jgi:hypothetical protein
MPVYVAEDDLALRAEASVSSFLWKRLLKDTELISLEPKETTKSKIGVNNEWINVQDPEGEQGFVAAWYVSETKGKPVSVTTASVSPAGNLPPGALALVPTEDLAFRIKPVIAPETLIRRIPVTEQVISVEPASEVIRKVGVNGEWLKVKDSTNREGYVAAWYVKYASGSTAQQAATPAGTLSSNGGAMKVKTTAEGVALRKQAIVSDSTLIKRLPLGTELLILEPNAEAKIGKNDQWLKVKDPTGSEGVVAAWFVAR